jgi:uncharacterized membrane protein
MLIQIIPNWHPIFVHFSIALLSISTLMIASSFIIKNDFKEKILNSGYINLWVGCLITFGTVAAGFYAYNTVAHDGPSHAAMTDHKNWALTTAITFLILTLWSVWLYRKNQKQNILFIACLLVATSLLGITGLKGGEVVYRYGLGVMSMPNMPNASEQKSEIDEVSKAVPVKNNKKIQQKISNKTTHDHSHQHGEQGHDMKKMSNENEATDK